MSANIYWVPTSKKRDFNVSAPSSFVSAIERCFGSLPRTFDYKDLEILKGMAAVYSYDENPFENLIRLIEDHEEVELSVAY